MNRLLIASLAIFAVASGSAMAADMALPPPVYKAPPPPAPNWTGCYVNGGGGYGLWNQDQYSETYPGLVAGGPTSTSGGRGWFGTVGGGCDYQFNALNTWNVVIGAFGDFNFMNLSGIMADPVDTIQGTANESSAWAAGLRAGVLVTPTLLTYINGGYTQAHFNQVNFFYSAIPSPSLGLDIASHDFGGWFIGGGTEYALTFLPGLFWRNEYRFSSYQSADLPIVVTTTGTPIGTAEHVQPYVQTISTGLVWRFNWAGPISARY